MGNYEQERRKKEKNLKLSEKAQQSQSYVQTDATTPTIVGPAILGCCVRLHLAKSLTGFKLWTTTPNNAQQHATGRANGSNM